MNVKATSLRVNAALRRRTNGSKPNRPKPIPALKLPVEIAVSAANNPMFSAAKTRGMAGRTAAAIEHADEDEQ